MSAHCLPISTFPSALGLQTFAVLPSFSMGARKPNLGPLACTTSSMRSTEPSHQPQEPAAFLRANTRWSRTEEERAGGQEVRGSQVHGTDRPRQEGQGHGACTNLHPCRPHYSSCQINITSTSGQKATRGNTLGLKSCCSHCKPDRDLLKMSTSENTYVLFL